jgi:selenocysteine lyase/cysteine desulfurase
MGTTNRRAFLRSAAAVAAALPAANAFASNSLFSRMHGEDFNAAANDVAHLEHAEVAQNEDFWAVIQRSYSVNPDIINLNNGGVSPAPIIVQQAVERYNQLSNEGPSYYMWQILDQGREPLRAKLALLAGANPNEIAVDRNSTVTTDHCSLTTDH